ncbi:hypothetical protein MMC16_007209 [Acarospora aff. strigata]|nr:hypothetical protein [Acarospora aff. strigata]
MAGSELKVIALISGGKDSFFSILHCIANGHEVVALANLFPPSIPPFSQSSESSLIGASNGHSEDEDSLNSYMYQTVGHSIIPLYAEALGLPLYRQEIKGTAINADKNYAPLSKSGHDEDETECLIPLLQKVKTAHPTANALSTGAILSDYQRTRVESVAIRLGLVPLSYLWQYPYLPPDLQTSLLDDMVAVGQEAMIIKVASGGLDEKFLGQNVADEVVKRRLVRAMERFGGAGKGAVLGEGGEYETLALDGPGPVWKKRIIAEEEDREVVVGGGGTAWLRVKRARLEEKIGSLVENSTIADLRIPGVLDARFESLRKTFEEEAWSTSDQMPVAHERLQFDCRAEALTINHSRSTTAWTIANMTAPEAGAGAEMQMRAITEKLTACFKAFTTEGSSSQDDIVFTTVLLRSMDDFAAVNGVYATLFTKPNPPARATVACGDALPENVQTAVSFVIDLGPRNSRQGLHVESRSYWAPANIGPYSQAIAVPVEGGEKVSNSSSLVYVAGQIPLLPASMELIRPDAHDVHMDSVTTFRTQALLSLQHLWRIGHATEVNWWTGGIAFIAGKQSIQATALIACKIWDAMHKSDISDDDQEQEDTNGLDAWEQRYGGFGSLSMTDETKARHRLPNSENVTVDEGPLAVSPVPPFFAVQVDSLPRGADIEWESLGVAHGPVSIRERISETKIMKSCALRSANGTATIAYYSILATSSSSGDELQQILTALLDGGELGEEQENPHVTIYTAYTSCCRHLRAQIVPCRSVWGAEGRVLGAGVVVRRDGGSRVQGNKVEE